MDSWTKLAPIVKRHTGRTLVGTDGGLYAFTDTEIRVPDRDVEGAIHEFCHFVVASESERRQLNMGLSQDWTHPGFTRMVRCEELAWSLENYIFGDLPVAQMASLLTPEARASGGGMNISSHTHDAWLRSGHSWDAFIGKDRELFERERAETVERAQKAHLEKEERRREDGKRIMVAEAALAEAVRAAETVIRHGELRPEGSEELRREALQRAESTLIQVGELQEIVRLWMKEIRGYEAKQLEALKPAGPLNVWQKLIWNDVAGDE